VKDGSWKRSSFQKKSSQEKPPISEGFTVQTAEKKSWILISILSGISLLTRLLFLGSKSLWIDECLAWGAVRLSWVEMSLKVAAGTPHPPLAFAIIKLSSMIAGESEFGLRLLVAVSVASAVIPVFRLVSRRTTVSGGFWAGMVWALCPFAVSLGQEAWVYGINASLSLWFADVADMAWRGSKRGFAGSILLGAAGILTQHIFVLSVAVGCVLFFTIAPNQRIAFKRFLIVPVVLGLLYAPIFLFFSSQFTERSIRMASAGRDTGLSVFLGFQPFSQFNKILAGGLLPDLSANLLERPRMLAAYILNALVILFLAVVPFFTGRLKPFERKYLWIALLIPFGLFVSDEPGIRQLSVLWVPFAITSGAVFSRYRLAGVSVSILCLLALFPYYMMNEFPYHPSDWRRAVATVESLAEPGDLVVVLGGKSTSLAWEYYSRSDLNRLTPGGNNPFTGDTRNGQGERASNYIDPELLIDSLLTRGGHNRLWIILDCWGIPSISSIKGQYNMEFFLQVSGKMEVALLRNSI
jgi:hypothetical protein